MWWSMSRFCVVCDYESWSMILVHLVNANACARNAWYIHTRCIEMKKVQCIGNNIMLNKGKGHKHAHICKNYVPCNDLASILIIVNTISCKF